MCIRDSFWKKANKIGALCSTVGGTLAYCGTMAAGLTFFGLHQIVIGITISLLCMVVGDVYKRQRQVIMPLMPWAAHVLQWPVQRDATPRGGADPGKPAPVRILSLIHI